MTFFPFHGYINEKLFSDLKGQAGDGTGKKNQVLKMWGKVQKESSELARNDIN